MKCNCECGCNQLVLVEIPLPDGSKEINCFSCWIVHIGVCLQLNKLDEAVYLISHLRIESGACSNILARNS